MAATLKHSTEPQPRLYLAFELGWSEWKLAFTTAAADPWRPQHPSRASGDRQG